MPPQNPALPRSTPETADGAAGQRSALFVGAVEKAWIVLSLFKPGQRQLSLTQIAELTHMSMGSAQRFAYTLTQLGLLRRAAGSRHYELSPRMLDLAYQYIAGNDLVTRSMPFLQQLSLETEETVSLTILDGADIIYVQRIVSRHVLTPEVTIGTRLPAYCTSAGLAILASLPEPEAIAILEASDRVAHTPRTVTEVGAIVQRLGQIRDSGYAHTEDELYRGDISTAVAIPAPDGRPLGAITITVAQPRWEGKEQEARIASLLMAARRAISSHGA